MHDWHLEHGARFVNAGLWKRPHSYPRPGESPEDAANREAKNVRMNVGVVDVSTLGKIELQGKDAAEFLNRVYINRWDTLAVGRCRYGVMLREDGIVLDDGTTSRLAATHYLMTTTTANAVAVMQHLERLLQVDWPDLEVRVASVTAQWGAAAVAGPRRREKGHVVIGPEADGRTTADDLGMSKLVSPAKWCIGKPLLDRPALKTADRWQLVGLTAQAGAPMPRAAKVVADPDRAPPN